MTDLNLLFQRAAMWPVALLVLAVLLVVWWTYRRTYPPLPGSYRLLLAGIRSLAVLLTGLLVFEPLLVVSGERTRPERVAVLVDRSASMLLPLGSQAGDTTSRLTAARSMLEDASLAGDSLIKIFGFGRRLTEMAGPLSSSMEILDDRTDLAHGLAELLSAPGPGWDRVVVVGDGRVNAGGDPLNVLQDSGVQVDAVLLGEPPPPGEISMAGVEQSSPAYEDGEVGLELTLARGTGESAAPGAAMVDIYLDGRKVAESRLEFSGSGAGMVSGRAVFPAPPAGSYWLEASLREADSEWSAMDNHRLLRLNVRKSKRTFLIISNSPDWDISFTARTLSANEDWRVETVMMLGGPGGANVRSITVDGFGPGSLPSSEELHETSLVLLHGRLNEINRSLLERVVQRMAAGEFALVLWPAEGFDPRALPPEIAAVLPLASGTGQLTPVEAPQSPSRLFTAGRYGVLSALGGGGVIDGLPPLLTVYRGLQLSRQAEILARAGSRGPMAGEGEPVLAVAPSGGVRTALIATQGLWRWHMQRQTSSPEEAALYGRMWTGLAGWLTSAGKMSRLTFEPEREVYGRGEPLRFTGSLAQGENGGKADVSASLWRIDSTGAPDTLAVRTVAEVNEVFSLDFGPYPPGRYAFSAVAVAGADTLTAGGVVAVEEYSPEFAELAPDSTVFVALTAQSGGILARGGQMSGVLARGPSVTGQFSSALGLARAGWIYWLIVLLLAAEWALRRRKALS